PLTRPPRDLRRLLFEPRSGILVPAVCICVPRYSPIDTQSPGTSALDTRFPAPPSAQATSDTVLRQSTSADTLSVTLPAQPSAKSRVAHPHSQRLGEQDPCHRPQSPRAYLQY